MDKFLILSKVFYVIAIIWFVLYLINNKSYCMALGGLSLIVGSILMIVAKKKNE